MIGLDVYLYPDGLRVATPEDIENWESDREMFEPNVRLFVALFSYIPAVMSPNPETMEEELPFEQGQIIKVKMFISCILINNYSELHNKSNLTFASYMNLLNETHGLTVLLSSCCDVLFCRYMEIKMLTASIAERRVVASVLCRATWFLRFLWKTESSNSVCSSRGFYQRRRLP